MLRLVAVSLLSLNTQTPQAPPTDDARIKTIVLSISAQRLEADLRKLVSFETRHTASDTLSATRGIGAARRFIKAEFDKMSAACGGCLEVSYLTEAWSGPRLPKPVNVVSVIAVQRGTTDPRRYLVMSGHFDSRNSDPLNATDPAPGANDDGSGTVAVMEAARVLSKQKFNGTIVYAALAGEEQGLNGGQTLARIAKNQAWRLTGVLNNDIVGNTRGQDGIPKTRPCACSLRARRRPKPRPNGCGGGLRAAKWTACRGSWRATSTVSRRATCRRSTCG